MKPTRRQCVGLGGIAIPRNRWDNDDNGYDDYDERSGCLRRRKEEEARQLWKQVLRFVGP